MRIYGWRIDGKLPNIPKFVLIGAPHTSNWDAILFLGVIFSLRANVRVMAKAEVFRFPFGWFFRYCGGIPVDRRKSTGMVDQMVKAFNESEQFVLTIAPEGDASPGGRMEARLLLHRQRRRGADCPSRCEWPAQDSPDRARIPPHKRCGSGYENHPGTFCRRDRNQAQAEIYYARKLGSHPLFPTIYW